jgi:DNA-binding transcriptional LysR family regulator
LNLLASLDVLLTERSVTRAAVRLGLSASAMSRTLSRLRTATGDQLLVQAGRMLVPTPYAEQISGRVHDLAQDARALLKPVTKHLDVKTLERTFAIRAGDDFVTLAATPLLTLIAQTAPHVRIHFVPKSDKEAQPHRDGMIDLEIGVIGSKAPELKTRLLFEDKFVGICRLGHPIVRKLGVTAKRYTSYAHVVTSRKRQVAGPVDEALEQWGLRRSIVMVVPNYANAMHVVRHSDLIGLVPLSCLGRESAQGTSAVVGLQYFDLPMITPKIKVSAIWHPRFHSDPAHRWLRDTITAVCNGP